jgi:outer membrane protein assembly factor BamB
MIADGLIYVMNDDGRLTLVEATPKRYRQLAEAQVLTGHDSWGAMALCAGRLLVRDLTRMVCLDVAKK